MCLAEQRWRALIRIGEWLRNYTLFIKILLTFQQCHSHWWTQDEPSAIQRYKGSFICPDVGKCGCTCIVLKSHGCVPFSVVKIQLSQELQVLFKKEEISAAFGVIFPFCFYLNILVSKQVSLLNMQTTTTCYFLFQSIQI